jgi:hypothetical protein
MVKFRGVDIKTGRRHTKVLKDDGIVYLLRAPKYKKTGFVRILRRFFKRLSKRTGKKWISIYWDAFEFKVMKPYMYFENQLVWYLTRPMLLIYSYCLLLYDFLVQQYQKFQPKLQEVRIWWENKKYFYGLKAYYIDYRTTEDWNIHMMRRERRGVFAYNKKVDYIAPFKIFLIYNYLWITVSEIEGELLARSELFFYEWFYRLEFRLTLRFLKLIRTLPHFFNAPILSEYVYTTIIETKAVQTFLKSRVLQRSRDLLAVYVFKGYLYFTYDFLKSFIYLRLCLLYYVSLNYFVDVLLKMNISPILIRRIVLFNFRIDSFITYLNFVRYLKLDKIKEVISNGRKSILDNRNRLLLSLLRFFEEFYKSDRFSLVRYLKYYRIIALGKNYFSNLFYKLFLVIFLVTNFYVFIQLHPSFYTAKPYVSGGMYAGYMSNYYFNIIINFLKDFVFSLPIADFSSEFLALLLLCYIWVKSMIYFNPIVALLFLWFGFFLILIYFLPADKNPFLSLNYNKFEAEIIEELQKFIDFESASKVNYFNALFKENKLSNITKNAFVNDLVFEFNNDARASYELLWFETSADNSESLMHVSPLLYLNDYYSFAVMPSMMEDDYPVAIGFDDEEMEYNVHWVLAEAQVAPESGYNADIEADLSAENVFEEDNTYDFPIEPAGWEFDDEIDEDPIDIEEFMHVYQMMYSAPDYLLHEIYWDVYYQQTMDEAEVFEDESFLPRVFLEMYSVIKYRDLFGDPNCDDVKEEEEHFQIVKVFTRETRIPYDMIWLDTGAFPGEANGGDERAELEPIEHANDQVLHDVAWNLIHSNLNTYYMERIPYGKRNLDLIQRNSYVSYEIDYFLMESRNIPKLTRHEIFELRLDGILIDDPWEDNGMVLMNEDEDFDDLNAFVDFVSAEHYDNTWAYNSAIIDGVYHFIEMDDEDDLQADYPSIAVSEWARNELKHLELANYIMFEDWMKATPSMLKPVDSDIAESSNFKLNTSRKYMELSKKVALDLDFDLNYSEFQDAVLNTAYDSNEDCDLLDLYMDKVYTTHEIFSFDPEENDITWHDIYEAFLGYMPNVFGDNLEGFDPGKNFGLRTYDETDSYIMFGMDLENEFYNMGVYSYSIVTVFLITVYYNIIKLKFYYMPNMNFVVRLKEPGFVYQGEPFWDQWVRKWRKGSKRLRKKEGTFEQNKERLVDRDDEHIKIVVTKKLFPGFGYEKLFAHSIFFTALILIALELIIYFHVLKWDYLEAKRYVNNGGQTLLYRFNRKKVKLNNSNLYLFSPEENANYATNFYAKNKNSLRKWVYDIDEDGRNITEIPRFYTFDSDIKRYSFNNLFPMAPDLVEYHSLAGFVGDFPSPDMALLEGFLRDPLGGLGIFRQHHKYYEGEMYNLMVLQIGPYEDYEPSDEVMEDVEDAWRINIKSYGVGGDGGDAIDIYTKYHSFINWASIVWNDTDIMLWRRLTAQGRYFSNYEHVGNKMNQTYDTEYDIWVFVAGFNHERKKLAGIRYHNENRAKFKYSDLKVTTVPYLLRRLITRRFLPLFFKNKFKEETLKSVRRLKKRKILRSKKLRK